MTPGIVVSVVKGKGGFSANDLFAAGATNLAISAELFMEVWDKTGTGHIIWSVGQ